MNITKRQFLPNCGAAKRHLASRLLLVFIILLVAFPPLIAGEAGPLKTDRDKRSYAVGMAFAVGLKTQAADLDMASVLRGLNDMFGTNEPLLSPVEARELAAGTLAGELLKAKARAQEINCVNNLKQVGLAFRLWAGDHEDRYPFNLRTNRGGTAELCFRDANGFERDATPHLRVMSEELYSPKILVCPADEGRRAAVDWRSLTATNISYLVRSGTNIDEIHPEEILAQCPVHKSVLKCDGSVVLPK